MSNSADNFQRVSSVDEVAKLIRSSHEQGQTVSAARESSAATVRMELSGMNQVVEYPARDMTITVQAGVTLQQLSDQLAEQNQQLPVDTADPNMTVGAFVAADLSGPRQYGYGTLRDYLIGMEAVDGQGRVFHAGGRVVKNVAGYDLCRLAVGSQGTIGILTQLTFKLKPTTEQMKIQSWTLAGQQQVAQTLERLNTTSTRPVVVDLTCQTDDHWTLFLGVDGTNQVCDWQIAQLTEEIGVAVDSSVVAADLESSLKWCAEQAKLSLDDDTIQKMQTLPSKVPTICAAARHGATRVHAHAGNGIVIAKCQNAEARDALSVTISPTIQQSGGHLIATARQADSYRRTESWSARVVSAFDPHKVFA